MSKIKQFLNRCKKEFDNLVYRLAVWWKIQDTEERLTYIAGGIFLLVGLLAIIMSQ